MLERRKVNLEVKFEDLGFKNHAIIERGGNVKNGTGRSQWQQILGLDAAKSIHMTSSDFSEKSLPQFGP